MLQRAGCARFMVLLLVIRHWAGCTASHARMSPACP